MRSLAILMILTFFEVLWSMDSGGTIRFRIEQTTPPCETGFDWAAWVGDDDTADEDRAPSRLTVQ